MGKIEDRVCNTCTANGESSEYSVLFFNGWSVGLDNDDDTMTCPECGGDDYKTVVAAPQGINLGDEGSVGRFYPRFDRGLGCRVSSHAHREQIMEERGLVALEGGAEISSTQKSEWRKEDKDHSEYEKLIDKYDNAPEFSEYRRLKDRGAFDNWEP